MRAAHLPTLLIAALAFGACATAPGPELQPDRIISLLDAEIDGDTPVHRFFEGELPPLAGPVALDVRIGAQLAFLADNRGPFGDTRSLGLRDGFASGGFLGGRDLESLLRDLEDELTRDLEKRGVAVDADASTLLRVVLVDAQPNRPTYAQLAQQPGLSLQSFGRGGASFEGELIGAGGESLGTFTYGYYDELDVFLQSAGIWTDADRAVERVSDRLARAVGGT